MRKYWVFRRHRITADYKRDPIEYEIEEAFALHYVAPFKTRRKAENAVKNALIYLPEQEFIILRG